MNLFASAIPSLLSGLAKSFLGSVGGDLLNSVKTNGRSAIMGLLGPPQAEVPRQVVKPVYNKRTRNESNDDQEWEDYERPRKRVQRRPVGRRVTPRYRSMEVEDYD